MQKAEDKIKYYFSYLVFVLIIVTVIIVLAELFYPLTAEQSQLLLNIDLFIVVIFTMDLVIEYIQNYNVKTMKRFFVVYWPDILAIMPFSMLFRAFKILRIFRSLRVIGKLPRIQKVGKLQLLRSRKFLHLKNIEKKIEQ